MTQTKHSSKPARDNFEMVREIIVQSLQLEGAGAELSVSSELLGSIPEIDSMAVVTILTAIEEQFGIEIDDAEISAETFETLGTLVEFVDLKCADQA